MCPHAQTEKITCTLVHDHVLLRQGLRRLLEDEPDIAVVAEAGNVADALQEVHEQRPEVVIADAQIFECSPDQIQGVVTQECAHSKVLLLKSQDQEEFEGCAIRHNSAEELAEMVRRTAQVDPPTKTAAVEWPSEETPRNKGLTAREREVLKLLAEGRTVRSAADVLGVSAKTVDAHKFNLMRKLGIHNKAELVMWAIQKRVVRLPVNF